MFLHELQPWKRQAMCSCMAACQSPWPRALGCSLGCTLALSVITAPLRQHVWLDSLYKWTLPLPFSMCICSVQLWLRWVLRCVLWWANWPVWLSWNFRRSYLRQVQAKLLQLSDLWRWVSSLCVESVCTTPPLVVCCCLLRPANLCFFINNFYIIFWTTYIRVVQKFF